MTPVPPEVQELVEDERFVDAIDRLMAADDLESGIYDRLLVELRHRAFATLDRDGGWDSWPRTYADPFPGDTGVPEVVAEDLSAELIGGAILHHGCLVVRGLLPAAEVGWFVDAIDRTMDARAEAMEWVEAQIEAETRGTDNPVPRPSSQWFDPFEIGIKKAAGRGGDRFVRLADSPRAACRLAGWFVDSGLRDVVATYLGERPAMIANKWILRRSPHGVNGFDYHQDGAFLGEGIRTLDCWIALSRCGEGTGAPGIDVIPRRCELFESDDLSTFPWSLSESATRAHVPGVEPISPVFEAGDALFFDERLPHRTSHGPELDKRYAIESWFVAPSSYPDKHVPLVL